MNTRSSRNRSTIWRFADCAGDGDQPTVDEERAQRPRLLRRGAEARQRVREGLTVVRPGAARNARESLCLAFHHRQLPPQLADAVHAHAERAGPVRAGLHETRVREHLELLANEVHGQLQLPGEGLGIGGARREPAHDPQAMLVHEGAEAREQVGVHARQSRADPPRVHPRRAASRDAADRRA